MPTLVSIDDPDDPRIAPYRAVRERDLVGREGVFVAEGSVVLDVLLRKGPDRVLSLLLAENRVERLAPALGALDPATPVFVAGQRVMDAIVGFPLHRGILALGRRPDPPDPDDLLSRLGPRALVVAAVGIGNHDNMGGLFRNAAAFGADALLLDRTCCDPLYRKAIRVSVGAALTVPFARVGPAHAILDLLARHGFRTVALSPRGAGPLSALARGPRMAALFGTEGPGLPESLLAATETVRIPMAGDMDSLNVATTAGIVLHHLAFVARDADAP